jgi:hypothetical protein
MPVKAASGRAEIREAFLHHPHQAQHGTSSTFPALLPRSHAYPDNRNRPREMIMKVVALGICIAALALGACRRETPEYAPMKLGGTNTASDAVQQQ